MSPQEKYELGRLIALFADGAITAGELEALEGMLRDSPEAQAFYHDYLALDVNLGWNFADAAPPAFDPEEAERVVAARKQGSRRRLLGAFALVSGMAAAVVLAIVLGGDKQPFTPPVQSPVAIARLVEQSGTNEVLAVDGSVSTARQGQELPSGVTVKTGEGDCFLVLEFLDGTKLELSADTTVHLSEGAAEAKGKQVFVSRGFVHADVVKQPAGRPLVMTTPHAVVEVVGTRFTASAASESTRVEMESGSVAMTRRADGKKIEVNAGRYAVADRNEADGAFTPRPLSPRVKKSRVLASSLPGPVLSIDLSRDDGSVAVGNWDGSVLEWNLDDDQPLRLFQAQSSKIRAVAYSPDGKLLATCGDDKTVRVRERATGKVLYPLPKFHLEVNDLAFSPDGRFLALTPAMAERKERPPVRLYDARTGLLIRTLPVPTDHASCLAFSADGKLLAAGGLDGLVRIWNVDTGAEIAVPAGHAERITALAFAPRGGLLATGSRDGVIQLWNTTTWQLQREITRHAQDVKALTFTPDGNWLACAGLGLVRIYNVHTGDERLTFSGHRYLVTDVRITSDGTSMITSGWDRTVRIWDLSVLEP
ncbi:MAG: FecR domain-containing protein [Gemmataceae bacterium]